MIGRAPFIDIISAITRQDERNGKIADALDEVVRDGANRSLVFTTPMIDEVVAALQDDLDDHDKWISWWLWDGPDAGRRAKEFAITTSNGDRVVIEDAGALYDWIVSHSQASEEHAA